MGLRAGRGGGIAFLIRRFELNFRVRYYFGYSDIVRNRNKYSDNVGDGSENPSGLRRCVLRSTTSRSPWAQLLLQQTGLRDLETETQEGEEPRGLQIWVVKQQIMETTRQQKIAKQIQKDAADIFQKEGAQIVRGAPVTVTAVRVSPDFSYAKIYVSIFPFEQSGGGDAAPRTSELVHPPGLGPAVAQPVENVPEIQFFLDDSPGIHREYRQSVEERITGPCCRSSSPAATSSRPNPGRSST